MGFTTAADYARQLIQMGEWRQQQQPGRILGYTIFCANAIPGTAWTSYDVQGEVLHTLALHYQQAVQPPPIKPPVEVPVSDPRAANCKKFSLNAAGQVDGIELVYQPGCRAAPYACVKAELIDEASAQGITVVTVTILDKDGIPTAERALMVWPYGGPPAEDSPAGPGNADDRFTTTSKYTPPPPSEHWVSSWAM